MEKRTESRSEYLNPIEELDTEAAKDCMCAETGDILIAGCGRRGERAGKIVYTEGVPALGHERIQ